MERGALGGVAELAVIESAVLYGGTPLSRFEAESAVDLRVGMRLLDGRLKKFGKAFRRAEPSSTSCVDASFQRYFNLAQDIIPIGAFEHALRLESRSLEIPAFTVLERAAIDLSQQSQANK
jgi:hypothetical protein